MKPTGDRDRRHPLHDALCAYHADPEVGQALVEALLPMAGTRPARVKKDDSWWRHRLGLDWRARAVEFTGTRTATIDQVWGDLETPVYANRGRYKQLIGHLDVYLTVSVCDVFDGTVRWQSVQSQAQTDPVVVPTWQEWTRRSIAVEVKAVVTSLGDLVRQIQRYRHEWSDYESPDGVEIERPQAWVVSSPGMTDGLQAILKAQEIIGVRPGAKFLDWCSDHGLNLPADARRIFLTGTQLALS